MHGFPSGYRHALPAPPFGGREEREARAVGVTDMVL